MPFQEGVQILTSLGLTYREARVYLALVRSGISTARTISKISNVRREDVYRIIPNLQKKSLVEKIITIPTKFKAMPVEDGFSILLKRRNKETSELQAKTIKIIHNFKENNAKTEFQEENQQFILIPGKEALASKREKAIETAQTSVDVVTSWKRYSQATFDLLEVFRKASKRGVIIRHVTEKPEDKRSIALARKIEQLFNEYSSVKVKYIRTSITSIVGVFDNKHVILITSPTLDLNHAPALWSNNPSLVEVAENYFEMMWTKSLQCKQ